jgi:hypothetical protein
MFKTKRLRCTALLPTNGMLKLFPKSCSISVNVHALLDTGTTTGCVTSKSTSTAADAVADGAANDPWTWPTRHLARISQLVNFIVAPYVGFELGDYVGLVLRCMRIDSGSRPDAVSYLYR